MQRIAKNNAREDYSATPGSGRVRRGRGFTLVELMIAIAILGVLVAAAAPSLTGMVREQRIKSASFDMFATFAYARSEALKRNASINIVRTGADWAGGWSVQSGGVTLRSQVAYPNVAITALDTANVVIAGGTVTYQGSGRLGTSPAPTFVFSATGTTAAPRCVVVNISGQASVRRDNDTDPSNRCG